MSAEADDLVDVADIAADLSEWPEWVVDEVDEQTVIRAREQCRPGCRAQDALTQLLADVRKNADQTQTERQA